MTTSTDLEKTVPVYIGWDDREQLPWNVAAFTLKRQANRPERFQVRAINHREQRKAGNFWRTWKTDHTGQLWDELDGLPASTQFSYTRFLTPYLASQEFPDSKYAVFMDSDMFFKKPIDNLIEHVEKNDPYGTVPVWTVHFDWKGREGVKMDGQKQTVYPKKLWSSFMVFNLKHPSVQRLTIQKVNEASGSHLHQFKWLADNDEIGELPPAWNVVHGVSPAVITPAVVHFSEWAPWFEGHFRQVQNKHFCTSWLHAATDWERNRDTMLFQASIGHFTLNLN